MDTDTIFFAYTYNCVYIYTPWSIYIYTLCIYILTLEDTGGVAPVLVRVFLEAALHHPIYADTHMYIYTYI